VASDSVDVQGVHGESKGVAVGRVCETGPSPWIRSIVRRRRNQRGITALSDSRRSTSSASRSPVRQGLDGVDIGQPQAVGHSGMANVLAYEVHALGEFRM